MAMWHEDAANADLRPPQMARRARRGEWSVALSLAIASAGVPVEVRRTSIRQWPELRADEDSTVAVKDAGLTEVAPRNGHSRRYLGTSR
jgi:hypothetical protein